MENKIINAVTKAREYFEIENYPGNFFEYIVSKRDYIDKFGILLFKQDLGESNSGFISYANHGLPFICLNYNNIIGHQNFTLAHEIGHYFLHKGKFYSDTQYTMNMSNIEQIEKEANKFAAEFLYPLEYVEKDIEEIFSKGLIEDGNEIKLADYINNVCEKYFISFKFALCRILFESEWSKSNKVIKKVNKVKRCVGRLSDRYCSYFHNVDYKNKFYQPYVDSFYTMKEYIEVLTGNREIGSESGKSILERNIELEGLNENVD